MKRVLKPRFYGWKKLLWNRKILGCDEMWNLIIVVMAVVLIVSVFFFLQPPASTDAPNNELDSLPVAKEQETVALKNGETFQLSAVRVAQNVGGKKFEGYAYNGQFPGPLLKVEQGSRVKIIFKNELPEPTTVHWHGLRLENRFDGVPDITQPEVKPGESFEYTLDFPDAGLFWYHPHVREDKQQELGLYGVILVEPKNDTNNMAREEVIILDDILIEENGLPEFPEKETNFAVMGRFGNTILVNGKTDYALDAKAGEIVRLYLLNAANAKPFNFGVSNTKLKVLGADVGFYPEPFFADSITIGPSERAIVDVFFEEAGDYSILSKKPQEEKIGTVHVNPSIVSFQVKDDYERLEENVPAKEEIEKFRPFFDREPDFEYELLIRWPVMDKMMERMGHGGMVEYPQDNIEWEDEMRPINEITTSSEVTWIIRDAKTKEENMDFFRTAKKGEVKKIRIANLETSSHPMQHPIHVHGNRFLVISENSQPNKNLVWKDTVLIPRGSTVDLLVDFSNSGDWMIHCHNAEHLSSGMMSMIKVEG